jgi:hypothetical protein
VRPTALFKPLQPTSHHPDLCLPACRSSSRDDLPNLLLCLLPCLLSRSCRCSSSSSRCLRSPPKALCHSSRDLSPASATPITLPVRTWHQRCIAHSRSGPTRDTLRQRPSAGAWLRKHLSRDVDHAEIPIPLSLSLSHTHTHTLSLSLSPSLDSTPLLHTWCGCAACLRAFILSFAVANIPICPSVPSNPSCLESNLPSLTAASFLPSLPRVCLSPGPIIYPLHPSHPIFAPFTSHRNSPSLSSRTICAKSSAVLVARAA